MLELPLELKALLTFLVTQGLKALFSLFGKDLSGNVAAFVALVVGGVVFFVEGLLALVPAENAELVGSALAFVAMLLSSFGTHYTYKRIGA